MAARLPPLNACRAFEAAVRLGSFARAAAELNVTATAISHQVKLLEGWTGKRLFNRRNNAVVPTVAARLLAPTVSDALERIGTGLRNLAGSTGPSLLTLSVQPDFALKWLIPRLPRFAASHPLVELHLVTAYRTLDLLSEDLDLAVRYLDPEGLAETGADLRADPLLSADLLPVGSPALFPPGRPADMRQLRGATLLHVLSAPEDWRRWLAAAGVTGVDAERGPKFDSYALSGEAAAQGWGVALGRIGFIEADIAAGRLVAPFATRLAGRRSWVLLTAQRPRKPQVAALRAWLLGEAPYTSPAAREKSACSAG
ncbi:MAG TPA: LysR substrate-binding domain-containing protein [Acetobacteraceae bacterium]|nr:LysR substrate-binding domain-containing protein [Acetobacteraceae bacterium]